MNQDNAAFNVQPQGSSRREFLKWTGTAAAASALAGVAVPSVHAAEDNTIRLALIGAGGRGCGAVGDAIESPHGPVKLVAIADLFQDRLNSAHRALTKAYPDNIDVPADKQFVGFDAYRKAIDCLRPGDVALLTGYAGFRPQQLEYAVEKGVNVFMEKSFAVDPPAARRVLKASKEADKKNLKIAGGLMCRHSKNRQEMIRRIREGELGSINLLRAYRMEYAPWAQMRRKPNQSELDRQIRNFTGFFWVSGGLWAEMDIHQIDEMCWIKDAWPVSAHGIGGRAFGSKDSTQNLDSYSVEWTFADGAKAYDVVRYLPDCYAEFDTFVHGTKCAAQFSGPQHSGAAMIYKDQRCAADNVAWKAPKEKITPWRAEWNDLLEAIRQDRPYNEAERCAMTNIADMMGRAATHMGRIVTWDEVMASNFQFFPEIDNVTKDSAPPVQADAQGQYPVPVPGVWSEL